MKYSLAFLAAASLASAQQAIYQQCGGQNWTGGTACASGTTCQVLSSWFSQCLPNAGLAHLPSTTLKTISTPAFTPAPSSISLRDPSKAGGKGVQYAGVNIAGFDFGCGNDGTCIVSHASPPLAALNGPDGAGQMAHFVKDDGMNMFRLPVGWQFLVNGVQGGDLDPTNSGKYDQLVQVCLVTGASCIVDIHNYARWNGAIIGQGGPSNDQFAKTWSQLATKYAAQPKVVFGIMNEPHEVDINAWATTVQAAVTAIRKAGASTQMILLPGNSYTSAGSFVSGGSLAALSGVKNTDGSTTNLVFDVHKYLDGDSSGSNTECVTDNIASAFDPLATALRAAGRQALLSETGGGNTASCVQYLCQQTAFLNKNADVYLGYTGWAAGGFDTKYVLSETPTNGGGKWTDSLLLKSCLAR